VKSRGLLWYAAMVLALLHLPVVVLALFSFNASRFAGRWTGFTTSWYAKLFERADLWAGLRLSLVVGVCSTVIATVLGTLAALALGRHRFRGRRTAEALLHVPLVTPEIVVGIATLLLFAALGVELGVGTIVLAHAAFGVPFVASVVGARLAGLDRTLEEAALSLGADELRTFRRVTLPLLLPGIVAGALLAFTLSFDDVVITFFVSGVGTGTLPLVVYAMVRRTVEPTVNAISTLIVVATTVLILLADRLARRRE
jgi:spermidine/putrescine transport system permease protein